MSSNTSPWNRRRSAANFVATAASSGGLFRVRGFVFKPFLDLDNGRVVIIFDG